MTRTAPPTPLTAEEVLNRLRQPQPDWYRNFHVVELA
jgi:uncharacterized protein